ncbi:SURF1 family protein [Cellulomonas fimi]|uniref:SURF1-like protein n=1 Tax=Cellulomonas fimi TaxID=1708 RepID=A0A7Y0M1L2_CELFI|nr:SURF1 family protein [Cellulomonas fimi]
MSPAARRAAGLVTVAVVLAVVCGLLGWWQWTRNAARAEVIATIEAGYDAEPVPLDEVLAGPTDALGDDEVWRPVTVIGQYDAEATALLRNRPVAGQPGFHVLVPFVVTGGTGEPGSEPDGATAAGRDRPVLVVDRGWVPTGADSEQAEAVPDPPRGTVEITVRLRADEPASSRGAPAGQVQAISIDQVLAAAGLEGAEAYAAYGALAAEDPAPAQPLGRLPRPSTDPGSNLSYAFQWWTFALGALVGFSWMARRELLERGDDVDGRTTVAGGPSAVGVGSVSGRAPAPRSRPSRVHRSRGPSAEDEEDALIDAQLR